MSLSSRTEYLLTSLIAVASLAVCLCATNARAQELSDIPAAFVETGMGARSVGMAGAVTARAMGAESIFWNPAGLEGSETPREFTATYGDQMGLVPYSALSGAIRMNGGYTLGVGLIYSGDEVLTETTALVGASRAILTTPWLPATHISAGASARTRWASFGGTAGTEEQVSGSALGFSLDLGLLVPLTESVVVAARARDLVGSLKWNSSTSGAYDESVPATVAFGLMVSPREAVSLELDRDKSLRQDNPDRLMAGAEVRVFDVASLRGGYVRDLPPGEFEEYTLGAGAGIPVGGTTFSVDFAYVFGYLENTMRFSLRIAL
ncbi:hypothetical protein H8D73_00855 [bacterium]|nr:hypothetical protein [bacterium]